MNEVNQLIIGAGIVNALIAIAIILMVKDWPQKSSRRSSN